MPKTTHNRESWLTEFAREVTPLIKQRAGLKLPKYRISCGWPSRGGTSSKHQTIGQCYVTGSTGDVREIFISPVLDDAATVAHVALHELLHAGLAPGVGHRKPFSQAAKRVGLEGKPTATVAGDDLAKDLKVITDKLGPYPHDRIALDGLPKQSTRMLKVMCPVCGYIARVTAKWLDEAGEPICPQCSVMMETSEAGEGAADPLVAHEQTVEYQIKAEKPTAKIPFDPRWTIRMMRKAREVKWFIIDYGMSVTLNDDGQPVAVFGVQQPRLTPAESRQEAIELIESLRTGLTTYEEIELDDEVDEDDGLVYGSEDDVEDENYLDGDEDEVPDYEDGHVDPEEEAAYAMEQAKRERWAS